MRGPLTCGLCGSGLTYKTGELDDGTPTTSWRCECGKTYGCEIKKGSLDLGLEREAPLGAQNDFAMFLENFEGVIGLPELTDDPVRRQPGAGPLNDEQTVARIKAGFGCMCRHEWLVDWGDPHCDGPLTRGGGGLCWTCKVVRRCGDRHFETNSYTLIGEPATLIDEIAVWDPEAVINLKRPEDPASP